MDRDGMDRLVTRLAGRIRRAWLAAIAHLQDENPIDAVVDRLFDPFVAITGLEAAAGKFAAETHAGYIIAGQTEARWVAGQVAKHGSGVVPGHVEKKLLHFDAADPPAVQWAAQNRLDLIREITAEQRDLIREILAEGARSGANPRDIARDLRDAIGLTQKQEAAVASYRRSLEAGQYGSALSRELSSGVSDRAIAAALRNEVRLTQAQIDKAVERYRANFVQYRAETIARTEALRVAHQGSEELYRQAIARGDLSADQLERKWNHGPPGKTGTRGERAFHRVMDGQVRAFGEPFRSGLGAELRFPGDPEASAEETANCRCVVTVRVLGGAGGSSANSGTPAGRAGEVTADEVALGDEAAIAEEEAAAAEAEQAALEAEFADTAPADEVESGDLAEPRPDAIIDAILADDLDAISRSIEAELADRGLLKGEVPNRLQVGTPNAGTDAIRDNEGLITVSQEYMDGTRRFAKRWSAGERERAELTTRTPRDIYESFDSSAIAERGDGVRVLLHEHIHGYGPLDPEYELYAGRGAIAEEVATEMVARLVMRERFGIGLDVMDNGDVWGGYGNQIGDTLSAIMQTYHMDARQSWTVLEEAALKYKRARFSSDLEGDLLDKINSSAHGTPETRVTLGGLFAQYFPDEPAP